MKGLIDLLTKPTGNIRSMYVYDIKINLLTRVTFNPIGAELLLQAGLMARLAEFSVLDLRPDPDTSLLIEMDDGGEESEGQIGKYHSVLSSQVWAVRTCRQPRKLSNSYRDTRS